MKKKIVKWFKTVINDFNTSHCAMHAAGLTYFAMLSLVPLLCVLLSVAKLCGADDFARDQINAHIDAMITNVERAQDDDLAKVAPISEEERERKRIAAEEFAAQAREISNKLFERIAQFDVWTFGWIGFGFFHVEKPRPIWKRAYLNIFTAVILPIFAALALSVPILALAKQILVATMGSIWLTKWVSDGLIWFLDSTIFRLAITLTIASLAFAYAFAVLPAKASALYGSFAFLPIVLAWLYMSWQIVLLGACITHASLEASEKDKR